MRKLLIVKDYKIEQMPDTNNFILPENLRKEYMESSLCITWNDSDPSLTPSILKSRYTSDKTNPINEVEVKKRLKDLKNVMDSEDYFDFFKLQCILVSEIKFLTKMLEK
ncbi:MAG: hypothetical protein RSF67_00355 [Clostridia bacterium]